MREVNGEAAFAAVYDLIYHEPVRFYDAQVNFLAARLGPPSGPLLDAGCGTGRQVQALTQRGYSVMGIDASWAMASRARSRLAAARLPGQIVLADLRALPGAAHLAGILCLESPLAYLLPEADLLEALAGMHRVLRPGGLLVVDVFDYPATLGPDGSEPQMIRIASGETVVSVRESHRCDTAHGVWRMRQEFWFTDEGRPAHATVEHVLSLRRTEDYAAALRTAGFRIEQFLTHYPDVPPDIAPEERMIFLARHP